MTRRRFVGYDCVIESDIDIFGADPCGADGADLPDIRVTAQPALSISAPDACIYRWTGEYLDFQPPGVGRFRCRDGDSIEVVATPGADPEMIRALLIATALPALLWMRGAFVLHAAAVLLPGQDRALAIAGPSGAGKSTLVGQLIARGAHLIADDTVRLSLAEDGAVSASGLPGGYFIRNDGDAERAFREAPAEKRRRRAPLGALVFLSRHPESASSITGLSAVGTVERLLANRHRPKVVDILGRQVSVLRDCASIAHRVLAYDWRREENGPALTSAEWETLVNSVPGDE